MTRGISSGLIQRSQSSSAANGGGGGGGVQMNGEMAVVLILAMWVAGVNATDVFRIGAAFQSKNVSDWSRVFQEATSRINQDRNRSVSIDVFTLPVVDSPQSALLYACDAIVHGNISVIVAFGGQDLMNLLTVIARHARLPLIAYNTERTPVYTKVSSGRRFYSRLHCMLVV